MDIISIYAIALMLPQSHVAVQENFHDDCQE
jgi:hypothetical protein